MSSAEAPPRDDNGNGLELGPLELGTRSFIQLPADSTGKKVDSWFYDLGAGNVYAQAMVSVDSDGNVLSTQNGLKINGGIALEVTGSGTANNQTPIAATDVSDFRWVSVQVTGTWSAILNFECSNDGTNWEACDLQYAQSAGSPPVGSADVNNIYHGPIYAKHFRARIGNYVSGTVVARAEFYREGVSPNTVAIGSSASIPIHVETELPAAAALADGAANPTTPTAGAGLLAYNGTTWDRVRGNTTHLYVGGNVASGVTDSGNPVKVGGVMNSTLPTLTNGQRGDLQLNPRGVLYVIPTDASLNVATFTASGNENVEIRAGSTPLGESSAFSDGNTNSQAHLWVGGYGMGYNGSTWDRLRTVSVGDNAAATGLLAVHGMVFDGSTFDRMRSAESISTTSTGILAAGVGPGFDLKNASANLGTAVSSANSAINSGADLVTFYIGTSTTGTFVFEATADDTNWVGVPVYNLLTGAIVAAGTGITPTSGDTYVLQSSAWRQVRIKTATTLGTTVAHSISRHLGSPWVIPQGTVAHDAVDAGYPIKIGGRAYTGTPSSVADLDRVDAWFDLQGRQMVGAAKSITDGDAYSSTVVGMVTQAGAVGTQLVNNLVFNGTSWDRMRGNTTHLFVGGNVASGATDSGNPVKVGGIYNATKPTYTDGQRTDVQVNVRGAIQTELVRVGTATGLDSSAIGDGGNGALTLPVSLTVFDGSGWNRARSATGDALAVTGLLGAGMMGYNGSSWDRLRVDSNKSLLASLIDSAGSSLDVSASSDAVVASSRAMKVLNFSMGYNGSTWDRFRTIESISTAPNVKTGVLAVGMGPGFDVKLNPANLGTAVNSAITNTVDGAKSMTYHIGTSTTGSFVFEVSGDDSVWVAAPLVVTKTALATVSGSITPVTGSVYEVRCAGWRQVRIKTDATLGATVAVKTTASAHALYEYTLGLVTADTELPAATAFADAVTPASSPTVGAAGLGYNGSTWDRLRTVSIGDGAAATGILVGGNYVYNGSTWDRMRGDTTGVHTKSSKFSTSTVTQVASSASSVTLKASNTSRVKLFVFNDSTQILYLKLAATASTTSYTVKMEPQAYWELPTDGQVYTGVVDGIWASANGNAYVTEIT